MTMIMIKYHTEPFPKSRIATHDVCAIGLKKHHVAAMIEIDVSESREKIKQYRKTNGRISFTAWLVKVIGNTVKEYGRVASSLHGRRRLILFDDVNVSLAVEKKMDDEKVPIPMIIEKVNERSLESITNQIEEARDQILTRDDIVLQHKSNHSERIYYVLPGFLRRAFWYFLIRHPRYAYGKMGNVSVTSVGMMGRGSGWFIPISVHPICFGIGGITKKPLVVGDKVEIREALQMTILLDHDVVDGALMARFISTLSQNIEQGNGL